MMIPVDPLDVVAVVCPEMLKVAVLERAFKMEALVVRAVVAVPMIVADVLGLVNLAVYMLIHLRFRM